MMSFQPKVGNRNAQRSFAEVPSVHTGRSMFNRSFTVKDTLEFDDLVPLFVDEIVPGDSINLNVKAFARLATQDKPLMDRMHIDFFFFFCPMRLLWSNWEKFCGAQDDPGDSIAFTIPTITINDGNGYQVGSLYDKMGLPPRS